MGEIDLRIASLEEPPQRDDDPADVVPEVSAGPPLSKIGDLWVLGRHRLLCGSALDSAVFAALMGEEPVGSHSFRATGITASSRS